jgi:hypothetical protein
MAGADETPNDRAGWYRPNKILPQNIESPCILGDASGPVLYARTILSSYRKTRPRLLSGEGLVVIWGEAATSVTGCEPTYPSGLPLPFLTYCNIILYRPLLIAHSGSSSTSGPSSYSVESGCQLGDLVITKLCSAHPFQFITHCNLVLHRPCIQQALIIMVKAWPFFLFCRERLPIR